MQNNILNPSFRSFYKRFTHPLQLFTIKKLEDSLTPNTFSLLFNQIKYSHENL